MGCGTLPEVRDGSGDPQGDSRQVERSSGRSGTGRKILPGVRDRSEDPPRGLRRMGGHRKVRDGWGGPPEGLGRVGGPSQSSGTGLGTLLDVRD